MYVNKRQRLNNNKKVEYIEPKKLGRPKDIKKPAKHGPINFDKPFIMTKTMGSLKMYLSNEVIILTHNNIVLAVRGKDHKYYRLTNRAINVDAITEYQELLAAYEEKKVLIQEGIKNRKIKTGAGRVKEGFRRADPYEGLTKPKLVEPEYILNNKQESAIIIFIGSNTAKKLPYDQIQIALKNFDVFNAVNYNYSNSQKDIFYSITSY